jgi:hypothetical protein
MKTIETVVKVDLPLPASATPKTMITTCTSQSSIIKQCPLYGTTPAVESAVVDLDTAVAALQVTLTKEDQTRAELKVLEGTRNTQVATVRLKHDGVESALNTASNNDPQTAQSWVGKVKSRAKKVVAASTTTAPPEGTALRSIKRTPGAVEASCTAEAGPVCYLFQQGTDPLHPETWPAPVMVKGHTHKFENLPLGQVLCVRIAIVRRGSVQSQWSPILQITVR